MSLTDGALFKLRLRNSAEARAQALASIRRDGGWFVARIGGPLRGKDVTFLSRAAAERGVNAHYDRMMMRHVAPQRGVGKR